nr:MAG TPA: hypothetical protein [Caudoviricetes sp.]
MVKTVTLTADTPQKITFDGAYPYYWIDNKSASDVYASVGVPEANADGTYTVAAGSQMRISGGVGNDGITLLGEGKVQIVASAIAACPFKVAPAVGGGGESDTVDEFLNIASTNPVQNRAIKAELDKKANSKHSHSVADISDFPDIPDKNTIVDWGFYIKLTSGISKSDLAADVQTSLNKADTALQEHQSLADYVKTTDSRLMSAEDKVKLDGIAEGANKTVVDTTLNGTSENPISNKAVNAALAKKAASSHTHDDRYYTKNALDTKLDELTSGNSACVCGIYTGDGVIPRTISLGFTPSAVLISSENGAMGATSTVTKSGALAVGNSVGCTYNSASTTKYTEMVGIVSGGFQLLSSNSNHSNGYTYHYVAFK